MRTIRQLGEFGLIRTLARYLPARRARVGVGDDCAVLPATDPRRYLLFACDPVVEGVHYRPQTPPYRVGWKAVARNLSDIAAMGGQPRWAVVSLGLRPNTPVRYVQGLYRGLRAAAQRFDCEIVGGDTSRVGHEQFVVVAILGDVERDRLVTRAGAKPGDAVFVTGTLGGSLTGKHLTFTPRLAEARWLVQHCRVHSMIDISDGLASDLQRLVEANHRRVGFEIQADAVPTTTNLSAALHDGEDFELLFTVAARQARTLAYRWPFATRLTAIGCVVPEPGGIWLVSGHGLRRRVTPQGYDHFVQR